MLTQVLSSGVSGMGFEGRREVNHRQERQERMQAVSKTNV
jgi:hypothetical protein